MNTPNERLMSHYVTRDVFEQKTAESLLERLLPALIAGEMSLSGQRQEKKIHDKDKAVDDAERMAAMLAMSQSAGALRHTPVPMFAPEGMPLGYSEGMVRLAAIAVASGVELAKEAGIGSMLSGVMPAIKSVGQKAVGAVGGALSKAPAAATSAAAAPGLLGAAKSKLLGPLGLKGNLALVGGTLGAGWLANKAVHTATGELGRQRAGSPVYGGGGLAEAPASTVNQWGVPQ